MKKIKRAWDTLTDEERRSAINALVAYFSEEREEQIGIVAAGEILDIVLRTAGRAVYNRALDDTKPLLEQKLEDTLFDIDTSLKKHS